MQKEVKIHQLQASPNTVVVKSAACVSKR